MRIDLRKQLVDGNHLWKRFLAAFSGLSPFPVRESACRHVRPRKDLLLGIEPLEDRRLLAVFSVSNLSDAGGGSLRDAITMANSTLGADEIQFSVTGTVNIESQLPTITDALTITGPGASLLTIDAGDGADNTFATGDGYRIFDINSNIDVTLSGITLTGGDTADGASGANGSPGENGGAIRSRGNLTLVDSVITGNAAGDGGAGFGYLGLPGISGSGGDGGGIFSLGGSLTVTGSTISGNVTGTGGGMYGSNGDGGGISNRDGNLTVSNSTVSGNTTGTSGGAGYEGNGGGIYNAGGNLIVTGSTISSNSLAEEFSSGGGIFSNAILTIVTNSTISGNSATRLGGGIFNAGGLTRIQASTITENTAPVGKGSGIASDVVGTNTRTEISGSIIAGNTNDDIAISFGSANTFISNGYNLIGSGADFDSGNQNALDPFTADATNLTGVDPLLGLLADNGGPTQTHALLATSIAIDAGDPNFATPPDFDQRGAPFARIVDGGIGNPRIDIGAFEVQSGSPPVSSADFDTDGDIDGADFLAWQRGFGTPMPDATKADGDADNDTDVDSDDLAVWSGSFGAVAVSSHGLSTVSASSISSTDEQGDQVHFALVDPADLVALAMSINWLRDPSQEEDVLAVDHSAPLEAAYDLAHATDEFIRDPIAAAAVDSLLLARSSQSEDEGVTTRFTDGLMAQLELNTDLVNV